MNKVTPKNIIDEYAKLDMINAAFIRDLFNNAIIIPKPGREQIVESATDNLEASYKATISTHGEEAINKAHAEDIAETEKNSLISDTLGYLPKNS